MLQRIVNWLCDTFIGEDGGNYECPECKGKGRYKERHVEVTGFSGNTAWNSIEICKRCKGTGRIDWVEKVTGRIR